MQYKKQQIPLAQKLRNTFTNTRVLVDLTLWIVCFIIAKYVLPNTEIVKEFTFDISFMVLLILGISAIQWMAYVCSHLIGHGRGLLFAGFFGGFVSSTAVFATMPKLLLKKPEALAAVSTACILSLVAMTIELVLIFVFAGLSLSFQFWSPLIIVFVIGIMTVYESKNLSNLVAFDDKHPPIDWSHTFFLAIMIFALVAGVNLIKTQIQSSWLSLLTFVSSLFEVHGVSLASTSLYVDRKISFHDFQTSIWLSLCGAIVSKIVLVLMSRNKAFIRALLPKLFVMVTIILTFILATDVF